MITSTLQLPDTNIQTTATLPINDLRRIVWSLKRFTIIKKYSHGTLKRSAMAMINYYMRLASRNMTTSANDLHVAM